MRNASVPEAFLRSVDEFLPSDDFRRFAGEQFRRNRFGDHPGKWYQENLSRLMEQAIRLKGIKPAELLRPARRESGSVAYCPRCLAQYVKDRGACSDCGFEGIVAFEGRPRATTSWCRNSRCAKKQSLVRRFQPCHIQMSAGFRTQSRGFLV